MYYIRIILIKFFFLILASFKFRVCKLISISMIMSKMCKEKNLEDNLLVHENYIPKFKDEKWYDGKILKLYE